MSVQWDTKAWLQNLIKSNSIVTKRSKGENLSKKKDGADNEHVQLLHFNPAILLQPGDLPPPSTAAVTSVNIGLRSSAPGCSCLLVDVAVHRPTQSNCGRRSTPPVQGFSNVICMLG
ncbi:hypothetical protein Nepgr_001234 [Nepenthes gracilis]|uniref:Uncharacterized protein n=1 Tax=Nepenthes gracilis TaxID=150966 RepID=A0AAD3P5N9_NEPGR|nr:hypothetical protein Nepgr_001234 [Nepenthes gracilis]